MKKILLLLLLLIPNLVMAKSFLCITENAAGITQNYGKGTFTSTKYNATGKYIVKKINNEWKVKDFGESDDSIFVETVECKIFSGETLSMQCKTMLGGFNFNEDKLRFVKTTIGDWIEVPELTLGNGAIEYGSCSSI